MLLLQSDNLIPILSASVSLVVLFITIWYDRWKNDKEKKNTRKTRLVYFASLVKLIVEYCERNQIYLKQFSHSIGENPFEFPLLSVAPKSIFEKLINNKDEELLFEAFTTVYHPLSKGAKTFRSIIAKIEHQNTQIDQVQEMVKKASELDDARRRNFKRDIEESFKLVAELIETGQLKDYADIENMLLKYKKTFFESDQTLEKANTCYVIPVSESIEYHKYIESVAALEQINDLLHHCMQIHEEIGLQLNSLKIEIESIIKDNSSVIDNLKIESAELVKGYFHD